MKPKFNSIFYKNKRLFERDQWIYLWLRAAQNSLAVFRGKHVHEWKNVNGKTRLQLVYFLSQMQTTSWYPRELSLRYFVFCSCIRTQTMKRQKENYFKNITWSVFGKQNVMLKWSIIREGDVRTYKSPSKKIVH